MTTHTGIVTTKIITESWAYPDRGVTLDRFLKYLEDSGHVAFKVDAINMRVQILYVEEIRNSLV